MSFRFEGLEIWQIAVEICRELFEIADILERRKLYRWAEQLRSAGMSMPNNIAEGSGSYSGSEFAHFLNIARRSSFECANILIILNKEGILEVGLKERLLKELEELSRKIHNFRNAIK